MGEKKLKKELNSKEGRKIRNTEQTALKKALKYDSTFQTKYVYNYIKNK